MNSEYNHGDHQKDDDEKKDDDDYYGTSKFMNMMTNFNFYCKGFPGSQK